MNTFMTEAEIEKKIEIEAQNLMYFEHMKKEEAFKKAKEYVYNKYRKQISD